MIRITIFITIINLIIVDNIFYQKAHLNIITITIIIIKIIMTEIFSRQVLLFLFCLITFTKFRIKWTGGNMCCVYFLKKYHLAKVMKTYNYQAENLSF